MNQLGKATAYRHTEDWLLQWPCSRVDWWLYDWRWSWRLRPADRQNRSSKVQLYVDSSPRHRVTSLHSSTFSKLRRFQVENRRCPNYFLSQEKPTSIGGSLLETKSFNPFVAILKTFVVSWQVQQLSTIYGKPLISTGINSNVGGALWRDRGFKKEAMLTEFLNPLVVAQNFEHKTDIGSSKRNLSRLHLPLCVRSEYKPSIFLLSR